MDRINGLSDELLVHILTFLPTQVAVSTSLLSKRWECLWMWLPKLEYVSINPSPLERDASKCVSERESLLPCFLNRSMPLHKASVIESFRLVSTFSSFKPEDIKLLIVIATSRFLRELEISYHEYLVKRNILPSSLYTCKTLVTLKLVGNILLDVPRMVGLPSLKELQLQHVRFLDGESFRRLLSNCPVLEHLLVKIYGFTVNMGMVTVAVPSLQNLSLQILLDGVLDGLVIDTPSLKYLKLEDYDEDTHSSCLVEDMPKLEEAYVDVCYPDIERLIGSIRSVKRLTLSSEDHKNGDMVSWNQPQTVPKCISSSLQTFNWSGYYGIPADRDIAVYILTNACRLKTVTILSDDNVTPKYEMIKELSLSYRASTSCRLIFD